MPMDMRLMIPRRRSASQDAGFVVVGDDGAYVVGDDGVRLGGVMSITLTYRGVDPDALVLTSEDFCYRDDDPMNFPILSSDPGLAAFLGAVTGAPSELASGSTIRFTGPGGSIDVKALGVDLNIVGNANASIDTWTHPASLPFSYGDSVTISLLS